MDSDTFQTFVFQGIIWGITYYFIRRGLNPENDDRGIEQFKLDAIYGSIAAFVSAVAMWYINKNVVPYI